MQSGLQRKKSLPRFRRLYAAKPLYRKNSGSFALSGRQLFALGNTCGLPVEYCLANFHYNSASRPADFRSKGEIQGRQRVARPVIMVKSVVSVIMMALKPFSQQDARLLRLESGSCRPRPGQLTEKAKRSDTALSIGQNPVQSLSGFSFPGTAVKFPFSGTLTGIPTGAF